MQLNENEMANTIYDTLMNNTNFPQFPIDYIIDQELVTGNCVEHPEITFTHQAANEDISYTLIVRKN